MSIGPMGAIISSMAGTPLAQTQGSEVERTQQEGQAVARRVRSEQKAEAAAGIGETDGEDHEAAERDADGRRPWQRAPERKTATADDEADHPARPQCKDVTGESGNLLDLSG